MAEYDTISKDLIQTYPKDFIRLTFGQDDVEVLDILDTEQNTVETRHMDSLIRVLIAGEEALIHTEFQTTDDPSMPLRMAGYMIRAIEQHDLPIYSSVIYLRRNAGRRDPGHFIHKMSGHLAVIKYSVTPLALNGCPCKFIIINHGQVLYLVEIIEAGVFNPQQLGLASLYRVSSACAVRA